MSLDVYLESDEPIAREGSGIFIREDGRMREVSREEWDERNPGHEPTIFESVTETNTVYSANITHNLSRMASAAGIYQHLWRPDEIGVGTAAQLVGPLREGLKRLRDDPLSFNSFNPENGWGSYEGLVNFVAGYLQACEDHPNARVRVWR